MRLGTCSARSTSSRQRIAAAEPCPGGTRGHPAAGSPARPGGARSTPRSPRATGPPPAPLARSPPQRCRSRRLGSRSGASRNNEPAPRSSVGAAAAISVDSGSPRSSTGIRASASESRRLIGDSPPGPISPHTSSHTRDAAATVSVDDARGPERTRAAQPPAARCCLARVWQWVDARVRNAHTIGITHTVTVVVRGAAAPRLAGLAALRPAVEIHLDPDVQHLVRAVRGQLAGVVDAVPLRAVALVRAREAEPAGCPAHRSTIDVQLAGLGV